MTAICYSQLSGFRSPWGGAGGRCWQEAGWFTGPPPPPPLPTQSWLWALHVSTPLSPSPPLFIPPFSPASFSLDSMSTPLSPLIYTSTFYPPLLFSPLHFILFIQGHLCCMEAVVPLGKDNDRGMNELKPKKVLHWSVLSVIDTQLMEAIQEL